ncbi:MAG: copper homeostasis protein CutC [Devosia nanyangense]|uniref:PF03932 family protein CutC n=1 Tax=Devosia nanyangense TaxID=1228055 RepID=A0A933NY68_9HYPH|nr:copper homeostasis protein CutC [Devosia nanyangense]
MKLEVCVADPQSLVAAVAGGADRIELCSALELGGLTPSPGMIALAATSGVPAYAMVRPRSGDFVFDQADTDAMLRDIDAIRAAGLAGVVIGASRPDGALDLPLLGRLVAHARGLGTTLHRAIDLVPDFAEATEAAVSLGVERILTSGGAPTAIEGLGQIALAHATARGRLAIMAGSGLRPDNVDRLLDAVPVDEVHSSCAGSEMLSAPGAVRLGFAAAVRRGTDSAVVAAFRTVLARR